MNTDEMGVLTEYQIFYIDDEGRLKHPKNQYDDRIFDWEYKSENLAKEAIDKYAQENKSLRGMDLVIMPVYRYGWK